MSNMTREKLGEIRYTVKKIARRQIGQILKHVRAPLGVKIRFICERRYYIHNSMQSVLKYAQRAKAL